MTRLICQIIDQISGQFTLAATVWKSSERTSQAALQWTQRGPRPKAGDQKERHLDRRKPRRPDTKIFPAPGRRLGKKEGQGRSLEKEVTFRVMTHKRLLEERMF